MGEFFLPLSGLALILASSIYFSSHSARLGKHIKGMLGSYYKLLSLMISLIAVLSILYFCWRLTYIFYPAHLAIVQTIFDILMLSIVVTVFAVSVFFSQGVKVIVDSLSTK